MYISAWHLETMGLILFLWICEIYSDFSVASCNPYIAYLQYNMQYYDVLQSRDGENYFSRQNVTDVHEKIQTYNNHKLRFKPVLRELNGSKVLLLQHFKLPKEG